MPRDPELRTLFDLAGAIVRAYHNELAIDERRGLNDPVALRFGGWDDPGHEYVAKISFDLLQGDEADPVRKEQGFIGLLFDPDPCLDLFLQATFGEHEDATMTRVARFSAKGIELLAPMLGMTAPTLGRPTRFYSDDGRYCFNVQGDEGGKIVQYRVTGLDETQWEAVAQFRGTPL